MPQHVLEIDRREPSRFGMYGSRHKARHTVVVVDTDMDLTRRQIDAIKMFIWAALEKEPEVKQLEVKSLAAAADGKCVYESSRKTAVLWLEVGDFLDEGTMAELHCRGLWQVFIGPRGGMHSYVAKRRGRSRGQRTKLIDILYDCDFRR